MAAPVPREWKCDGADKRASVDRRLLCLDRGLGGCHWSQGKLVSGEIQCKLIMVVLCGRWRGDRRGCGGMLGCEPGENALSHICLTKQTVTL